MGFAEADLTHDAFLGGRVTAYQPKHGYRAATDPVLLAAAVPAQPGQTVLELGCGAGIASLCLSTRVPDLTITGVERQKDYADLAQQNAPPNITIVTADLTHLPQEIRHSSFDHVIANPPYYRPGAGTSADNHGREEALREETPLSLWLDVAAKRLKPKGWLTMINMAERLPDMLRPLPASLGSVSVRPLAPRAGRPAKRVILCARKNGAAPFQMLAPLIMHDGDEHQQDGDDYSAKARAILRNGAALEWA